MAAAANRCLELMEMEVRSSTGDGGESCFERYSETGQQWPTSPELLHILRNYGAILLPEPLRSEQGYVFDKGLRYVSYGIKIARLSNEVVTARFETLATIINEEIKEQSQLVKEPLITLC